MREGLVIIMNIKITLIVFKTYNQLIKERGLYNYILRRSFKSFENHY